MRVLIVEDEAIIAMHLEMLVRDFGHTVCATAHTAAEALAQAAAHRPDVVLMDIRLGHGSSGIETAVAIRARQGIPSIFVSGNLDPGTRREAAAGQPIGFVGKPVMPVMLQRALEKAEARRSA